MTTCHAWGGDFCWNPIKTVVNFLGDCIAKTVDLVTNAVSGFVECCVETVENGIDVLTLCKDPISATAQTIKGWGDYLGECTVDVVKYGVGLVTGTVGAVADCFDFTCKNDGGHTGCDSGCDAAPTCPQPNDPPKCDAPDTTPDCASQPHDDCAHQPADDCSHTWLSDCFSWC